MSELRAVPLDQGQCEFLEQLGFDLMRSGRHEEATKLLAIALAWRGAIPVNLREKFEEPSSVIPIDSFSRRARA